MPSSPSDIARRHVEAALAEGAAHGQPADTVARALLGAVVEVYRRERGADGAGFASCCGRRGRRGQSYGFGDRS